MTKRTIFTLGYERRSPKELFELLTDNGVQTLFDVRRRPASRRKGLSKTSLGIACDEIAIVYAHDRRLGTPQEIMKALRETGTYDWKGYREYLDQQEDALEELTEISDRSPTALLCYELAPEDCHRTVVADTLSIGSSFQVVHL